MRQRAILLSLTLHAGVIAWSAHSWSRGPRPDQPPGLSVLIGMEEGANPLLEEAGESAPPPQEASSAEEDFTPPQPPAPAVEEALPSATTIAPLVSAAPLHPPVPVARGAQQVEKKKAERHAERSTVNTVTSRSAVSSAGGAGASGAGSGEGGGTGQAGGGGGYQPPRYLLRYKPLYPPAARAQHLEGTALIFVSVDSTGRVTRATLRQSSGHGLLDRAALEAVRSWHFEPARQSGTAVAAEVELPVSFRFTK